MQFILGKAYIIVVDSTFYAARNCINTVSVSFFSIVLYCLFRTQI